jgi:polysaccharide biosynthesis protein PslF
VHGSIRLRFRSRKQALMGVRFGFVSTFPPTQCGIATFSAALAAHIDRSGSSVGIVRVVDEPQEQASPVVHQWVRDRAGSYFAAARELDQLDVVVVQHEYGIFGGADGEDILDLVEQLHVPIVTVLHTVLTHPTPNQHRIVAELAVRSSALVTMTETGRDRLVSLWDVDPATVFVIPHGAEDNRSQFESRRSVIPTRPTVLTWGLLSPGKGIEWALLALAELKDTVELPHYSVVGRTHPRVLEREGEAYRDRLVAMAADLGLARSVTFDGRYLSNTELRRVVRKADVVLLPYDSREQVTSGVLTEAVAAGKPVISTSFPHAVELLSDGAGLLVPQGDSVAMAAALRTVLTDRDARAVMGHKARRLADSVLWTTVANNYVDLSRSLIGVATRSTV